MTDESGRKKPFALHLWSLMTDSCQSQVKDRVENPHNLYQILYFFLYVPCHMVVLPRFDYIIYPTNKHVLGTCYGLVLRIKKSKNSISSPNTVFVKETDIKYIFIMEIHGIMGTQRETRRRDNSRARELIILLR